jgi:hypothetical protein
MTRDESQEMDHGRRMAINLLPYYEDIEVMQSYTILEIMTLISNYEVAMERRYACIQCSGGMAPPSTMRSTPQSTTQSTNQRYGIMHLLARIPMANTIPDQIPNNSLNGDTAQALQD